MSFYSFVLLLKCSAGYHIFFSLMNQVIYSPFMGSSSLSVHIMFTSLTTFYTLSTIFSGNFSHSHGFTDLQITNMLIIFQSYHLPSSPLSTTLCICLLCTLSTTYICFFLPFYLCVCFSSVSISDPTFFEQFLGAIWEVVFQAMLPGKYAPQ